MHYATSCIQNAYVKSTAKYHRRRNQLERLWMYLPTKCLECRKFGSIQTIATYYSSLKLKERKKQNKNKQTFSIPPLCIEDFGTWVNCTRHITPSMTDAKQGQLQVKAIVFLWGRFWNKLSAFKQKHWQSSGKYSKYYLPLKLDMCSEDHESVKESMISQT